MHNNRLLPAALLALAGMASWPLTSVALRSDNHQPVKIEADSAEIDQKTGVSIYSGNVRLSRGTILITANKVVIKTNIKTRQTATVLTGKPATFRQLLENGQTVRAQANQIDYSTDSQILRLTHGAKITQGPDSVKGEKLSYNLKQEKIKARQRVELILNPGSDNNPLAPKQ